MCETYANYRVIEGQRGDYGPRRGVERPRVRLCCAMHLTVMVDRALSTTGYPVVVTSTSEMVYCQWEG